MNLIEKLGLEKCKQIADGAPKTATHYNMNILGGHYAREGVLKMKTQWEWFNTINKEWYYDFAEHNHIALSDLKSEIDHHYYGRSEAEELAAYAELSQEKIEGGAMFVGDNSKVVQMVRDITDHCTDIKNHISPNTKVIEHE